MLRYGFLGGLLALFESCAFKYIFLDSLHSFQSAFDKLSNAEEQIRAVDIAVVALVATNLCSNKMVIRRKIKSELSRLLDMDVS